MATEPIYSYRTFSFGLFPDDCSLNANVSEHSVCSIFIGEWYRLAYENEMLVFKFQTPGNNSKENMQRLKHGESLKSRIYFYLVRNSFLFFVEMKLTSTLLISVRVLASNKNIKV
jgi:hypothetical protein